MNEKIVVYKIRFLHGIMYRNLALKIGLGLDDWCGVREREK